MPGGSLGPQLWTAAGSPYLIQGDLMLESLTVEAGTVVRVGSVPEERVNLTIWVNGPLIISANETEPAVFEPVVDGTYWGGIRAQSATVRGAVVRWGEGGITTTSSTARSLVRESTFEQSRLVPNGPLEVDRSRFFHSGGGIVQGGSSEVVVTNSLFRSKNYRGYALDLKRNATIVNCTFDDFRYVFFASGGVTVRNSIFTNADQLVSSGSLKLSHSLLWNVTKELPRDEWVEGEGILRMDPRYVSGEDLRLRAGSPAIDVGVAEGDTPLDLAGESRPQGAGIDLGAYEFVPTGVGGEGGAPPDVSRPSGGRGSGDGMGGHTAPGGASASGGGAGAVPPVTDRGGAADAEAPTAGSHAAGTSSLPTSPPDAPSRTSSGCGCSAPRSDFSLRETAAMLAVVLLMGARRRLRHVGPAL